MGNRAARRGARDQAVSDRARAASLLLAELWMATGSCQWRARRRYLPAVVPGQPGAVRGLHDRVPYLSAAHVRVDVDLAVPARTCPCLLYTSDAADDLLCVDL